MTSTQTLNFDQLPGPKVIAYLLNEKSYRQGAHIHKTFSSFAELLRLNRRREFLDATDFCYEAWTDLEETEQVYLHSVLHVRRKERLAAVAKNNPHIYQLPYQINPYRTTSDSLKRLLRTPNATFSAYRAFLGHLPGHEDLTRILTGDAAAATAVSYEIGDLLWIIYNTILVSKRDLCFILFRELTAGQRERWEELLSPTLRGRICVNPYAVPRHLAGDRDIFTADQNLPSIIPSQLTQDFYNDNTPIWEMDEDNNQSGDTILDSENQKQGQEMQDTGPAPIKDDLLDRREASFTPINQPSPRVKISHINELVPSIMDKSMKESDQANVRKRARADSDDESRNDGEETDLSDEDNGRIELPDEDEDPYNEPKDKNETRARRRLQTRRTRKRRTPRQEDVKNRRLTKKTWCRRTCRFTTGDTTMTYGRQRWNRWTSHPTIECRNATLTAGRCSQPIWRSLLRTCHHHTFV